MTTEEKMEAMQRAIDAVWATWTQGAPLNTAVRMVRELTTDNTIKPKPDYCCTGCGKEAQQLDSNNWLTRINPGEVPSRWICMWCKNK